MAGAVEEELNEQVNEKIEEAVRAQCATFGITDIDDQYIATVITSEDIVKVTNQLMHSMGGFMGVFKYALISRYVLLV